MTPPLTDRLPVLTEVIDTDKASSGSKDTDLQSSTVATKPGPVGTTDQPVHAAGVTFGGQRVGTISHGANPDSAAHAPKPLAQLGAIPQETLLRMQERIAERLKGGLEERIRDLLQNHVGLLAREIAGELQPWLRDEVRRSVLDVQSSESSAKP